MHRPELTAEQIRDLRALAGTIIPASTSYGVPGADDELIFNDILRSLERDREDVCRALAHLAELSGGAFAEVAPERRDEVASAFAKPAARRLPRWFGWCCFVITVTTG